MPKPSPTDGKFEQVLAGRPAAVADLARRVRRLVRETLPDVSEVSNHGQEGIGFGVNQYGYDGWGVGTIGVAKNWVTLGFMRGAHLPDPTGIVEGTGRNVRHVKIRSLREFEERRDALVALLRAATGVAAPPAVQGALDLDMGDEPTRHSALAAERSRAARSATGTGTPALAPKLEGARTIGGRTLKKRSAAGVAKKLPTKQTAARVPEKPAARPAIKTLPKNPLPKKPLAKRLTSKKLGRRWGR